MRQWVVGVALFTVVASSGCALSESRGVVLQTSPQPVVCQQPTVRGELGDGASGHIHVSFRGEDTCGGSRVVVYRKERWLRFDAGGVVLVLVGSGVAGALGALGLLAANSGPGSPAQWTTSAAVGQVVGWSGFGIGAGIGLLPAFLARRPLPAGTEVVEEPEVAQTRDVPVEGDLVSSSGALRWPLAGGEADLEAVDPAELESARVNGLVVQWSPRAGARLAGLASCRRAITGWSPGQPLDCSRVEPALRCAEGGWLLASRLLDEAQKACPSAPSRRTLSDLPPPRPETPCVTPSCSPPLPR